MSDKPGGGSSQPNGPNETARDAARDAGLDKSQQQQLQRELEESQGGYKTYREIRELAEEVKKSKG